jgi:Flp pilus assembly protein TadD
LLALADRLTLAGCDATSFRGQVQQQHVGSFLANLSLADALRKREPAESIRYYQAALAIRPLSPTAHNNLAVALDEMGRSDEAMTHLREAVALAPDSAAPHYNLGLMLARSHPEEAARMLERALALNKMLLSASRALRELTESGQSTRAAGPQADP